MGRRQGGGPRLQDGPALEEDCEGLGQAGDDLSCRGRAGNRDGLLGQRGGDLLGQGVGTAHPRRRLEHDLRDLLGAGLGQFGRGAEGLQQGQHGRVPQAGSEDAFEGGVDGGEQSAQPVGGAGGVLGEVVVVAQDRRQHPPDHQGQGQRVIPALKATSPNRALRGR